MNNVAEQSVAEVGQFIGYASASYDDVPTPIATGVTREECLKKTIRRSLAMVLLHGEVSVQRRDDVEPTVFHQLTKVIDEFCVEKGIGFLED